MQDFLNNHFELITYSLLSIVLMGMIIAAAIRFSDEQYTRYFGSALNVFLCAVLIAAILVGGWVFYKSNLFIPPQPVESELTVLANTRWVEDDLKIYYARRNELWSVALNGDDSRKLVETKDNIRDFYFSHDGSHLALITYTELYLLRLSDREAWSVDAVSPTEFLKAVITNLQWAPDNQKICYEILSWSQSSFTNNIYIYDLVTRKRIELESPTSKIRSLHWSTDSQKLYFIHHEALDLKVSGYPFDVTVFEASVQGGPMQLVAQFPFDELKLPANHLAARDIYLFVDDKKNHFKLGRLAADETVSHSGDEIGIDEKDYMYYSKRTEKKRFLEWLLGGLIKDNKQKGANFSSWVSEKGEIFEIDIAGHLYYLKDKVSKKKLFRVPRKLDPDIQMDYQPKGGELVVQRLRWLPGGHYVMLYHDFWGTLILDPKQGLLGPLIDADVKLVGWYSR